MGTYFSQEELLGIESTLTKGIKKYINFSGLRRYVIRFSGIFNSFGERIGALVDSFALSEEWTGLMY